MKRILIFNSSSFEGTVISKLLRTQYKVYGVSSRYRAIIDGVPSMRYSMSPNRPLNKLLEAIHPDAIVYTPPIQTEEDFSYYGANALYAQSIAPTQIAQLLEHKHTKFIYMSSDSVFEDSNESFDEDSPTKGSSTLGQLFIRAEESLKEYEDVYILRIGDLLSLGGFHHHSLLRDILSALLKEDPLKLHTNVRNIYTTECHLAQIIPHIIEAKIDQHGTYHVGSDWMSHFELGRLVAQVFELTDAQLSPDSASHRKHVQMDTTLTQNTFGLTFDPVEQFLMKLRLLMAVGHQ